MKPLIFDMNKKTAATMAICGLIGTIILLMVEKPQTIGVVLKCSIPLMTGGLTAAVPLLLHLHTPRITVTEESVLIENRRKGLHMELPWTNFSYAYKIEMATMSIVYPFYLLSDAPMNKETQKEMYVKCSANRETPYVQDGCLLLNAYHYGEGIQKRLPGHIRIMPWTECAHF